MKGLFPWVALSYLAIVLLQITWHALLPRPFGSQNWTLALLATVPLLLPLRGILRRNHRSMTWGGYLLVFYLTVGLMESWSNPAQRLPALGQVALILLYVISLVSFTRRQD